MTSQELLSILGGVKSRYILDAQNLRSRTGSTHRLYWKRAITILADNAFIWNSHSCQHGLSRICF